MRGRWLPVVLIVASGAACAGRDPTYSSDIGVEAVPVDEGSLAGWWVGQFEAASVVNVPIVGPRNGGSNSGRLVRLTWNAGAGRYDAEMTWCWADVFEVEGVRHAFDDTALARLRVGATTVTAEHDRGAVQFGRVLDLWGVRDMPDPYDTELPTHRNFSSPPQSDWVFDEDQDGHPGVTDHMSGTIDGDAYVVVRTIFSPHGVARTPDQLVGLVAPERIEQRVLDSTAAIWGIQQGAVETRQTPDPDPRASWFQMVRIADGATCSDVRAARADGRLAARRPF
ncbi:MAG: hypothetical protein HY904_00160 [Deltaproteobacteria bacterium]|nr:hypothetical protein [Deltaproteobacteria bacterium]